MKHIPRKRFGQHFLTDPHIINELVMLINAEQKDHLVEIGPGLGALSQYLIGTSDRYDAVELDRDLIAPLTKKFSSYPSWQLHQSDALEFDFSTLKKDNRLLRVVGNLPYNISTPLLFHLLEFKSIIQDMHFMLQQEVVERLTAQPGDTNYGRLTIMMQYHCTAEYLLHVPPEAFDPPPRVESAVVKLTPHHQYQHTADVQLALSQIVTTAFSHRRKTIGNSLKSLLPAAALETAEINSTLRPQQLSLPEYLRLAQWLTNFSTGDSPHEPSTRRN